MSLLPEAEQYEQAAEYWKQRWIIAREEIDRLDAQRDRVVCTGDSIALGVVIGVVLGAAIVGYLWFLS